MARETSDARERDGGDEETKLVAAARSQWSASGCFLNTASYGLPPRVAWDPLQRVLGDWRSGRTSWEGWGDYAEGARREFARMVHTDARRVAIGSNVSSMIGPIASSLPAGARVVMPEVDFTSVLFPFLVQEAAGRCKVRLVPVAALAESLDTSTDLVAFSAVQMSTGEVADLDEIIAAARATDTRTLVDATQAAGWLPLNAESFDFLVCAAYKWLLSPRGTAFMYISAARQDELTPMNAGWYAGDDVHDSYFGPPLRLATSARRYDTSPAWFSWVGAQPALELLNEIGVESIHAHDLRLANRFRDEIGLPPSNSPIVLSEAGKAADALPDAGIAAAVRGGRLRTSWHVYNTDADVDRVLEILRCTTF